MKNTLQTAKWMLALETLLWLTVAWVLVDVLPGHFYTHLLPRGHKEARIPQARQVSDMEIRRLARAITLVGNRLPFRCECVHRAIAAYRMLKRRGVFTDLHFGVARCKDTGKLLSHVWVTREEMDVVGGADAAEFTRVGSFPLAASVRRSERWPV